MFRTDKVLKMNDLKAIMKKDKEVAHWYTDIQNPPGPSTDQDDEARKETTLAILDQMEE